MILEKFRKSATLRRNSQKTTFPWDFFFLNILYIDFSKLFNNPKQLKECHQFNTTLSDTAALPSIMSSYDGMPKGLWGLTRVAFLFGPIQIGAIVHKLTDGEESAAPLAGVQLLFLGRHKDRLASLQSTVNCHKTNIFLLFGLVGCFCAPSLHQTYNPAQRDTGRPEINPSSANNLRIYFNQSFSFCSGQTWDSKCYLVIPDTQLTSKMDFLESVVFEINRQCCKRFIDV